MRASCIICSDLFEGCATIVSVPCGHVYHENCLIEWLGRSKTCPECRTKLTHKSFTKLYFNIGPNTAAGAENNLENLVANLQARISEQNIQMNTLREEKEEIRCYVRIAEEKAAQLEQDVYKLKSEKSSFNLIIRDLRSKADKVEKLEATNRTLVQRIELLSNIQTVLSGTQKDVDDIMESMSNDSNSVRSTATYCSLLKRELKKALDSKQELRNEIANLRKNASLENIKVSQLKKDFKLLKEQNASLENENLSLLSKLDSLKPKPSGSNIAEVVYESPAPERLKSGIEEDIVVTPVAEQTGVKRKKLGFTSPYEHTITIPIKLPKKINVDAKSNLGTILKNRETLKKNNENSAIRSGYDGLGGHGKFIQRSKSCAKFKPPSKR